MDIFRILNGIPAKTRNLIFQKKKSVFFLSINQMMRNASQAIEVDLGEFNFLKLMHHIINSCTNMSKI